MAKIIIYSKANCSYCTAAKQYLDKNNLAYQEIRVDLDGEKLQEVQQLSGRRTLPQIFINDSPVGGYDDLMVLARTGKLADLIK